MRIKQGCEELTIAKARLIAHLIGDGALYKTKSDYVLKYEVRDYESLWQFHSDIIEAYGLVPSWEWNTSGKTGKPIQFVRLRSKLAYLDLLRYATYASKDWRLKTPLIQSETNIKREFLRALYDDEGSVKSKTEICLYSINRKGLLQIMKVLKEFNLDSRIVGGYGQNRNVYGLIVGDFIKFYEKISFNLGRKVEKLKTMMELKIN